MKKLNEIRETLLSQKLLILLCVQVFIIFVLLCVWLVIDWKVFWGWITKHTDFTLAITLIATVLGALIVRWIIRFFTYLKFYSRPYITFEADFMQVFHLSKKVEHLEYSVGQKTWEALGTQNIVFGGSRGKLLLRGQNKKGTDGANISFATNAQVICTGDICTLVDYKRYDHADTKEALFCDLFWGCTQLVVAPELTPKVLSDYCYMRLFSGCTSLKTAPELPATELAESCYSYMFSGCTSLETAPELPATTLAGDCYNIMFGGCTSLKYISELPATKLANRCYENMFFRCTSLEYPPQLPAKELAGSCYLSMFHDCTSLRRAPILPATRLATSCYSNMFSGCTSLTIAPKLPATELADYCYAEMFQGCSSLNNITFLAMDINVSFCFRNWFKNTSPTGTFYKNKNAKWSNDGIVPSGWEVVLVEP